MYPCLCGQEFATYDQRTAHQTDCSPYRDPVLRRRYYVEIHAGADEWAGVLILLQDFTRRVEDRLKDPPAHDEVLAVTGGGGVGGACEVHVHPEMTPTKYFELLSQRRTLRL